jgi:uncharacterized protein
MKNVKLFLVAFCVLAGFNTHAQELFVRTFHAGDSVLIRWIPSSYALWQHGNSAGYTITRFGMEEYLDLAGQDLTGKGTVVAALIRPLPQSDTAWNLLAKTIPQSQFVYSALFVPAKANPDPKKREQEQNITYGFSLKVCDDHPDVAIAAGLFFVDHSAQKGQQYIYRVELIGTSPGKTVPAGVAAADEKQSVLYSVEQPSGQFRNRSMRLTFDVTKTREQYAGYIIERSEDSVHFERINRDLLSFVRSQYETEKHELVYEDSIPQNGKLYWYRVRGYSYFGLTGPPSALVRGKGKEEWNCYPVADTCYSPDNKRVMMTWSLPPLENPTLLRGVCVLRSDKVNGMYTRVSSPVVNVASFTDTSAQFTNYYMLVAISTENDSAFSFPFLLQLQDNEPPAIPEQISGTVDTTGIVRLKWNAVSAADLKGYRVFRCNSLREEFVEVSDSVIRETTFTDTITLQTLTRDVYYSVRSVDHVWNNSDFSTPAKLQRPDKIAPVTPVLKAIYHTDTSVVLQWINSSSSDVHRVRLLRTASNREVTLLTFTPRDTTSFFTDTSAEAGITYSYRLVAEDSAGNISQLSFPQMNFSPRVRPALHHFTGVADLEKRTITLHWDLPATAVDRFIVYKGKEGETVRSFKTLNGTTTTYIDNQLYPGNVYVYRVKAVMKDGAETKVSEVKVVY